MRKAEAALGRAKFDEEVVFDLSSPYTRTAERSSAAKKPHKKWKKPTEFFRWVSTFYLCVSSLMKLELPSGVAFALRKFRRPKLVCDTGVLDTLYQEVLAESIENNQRRNNHQTASVSNRSLVKRLSCISQFKGRRNGTNQINQQLVRL